MRVLLECSACGLQEDVTADGRLITHESEAPAAPDTGLRFVELSDGQFACPRCGASHRLPLVRDPADDVPLQRRVRPAAKALDELSIVTELIGQKKNRIYSYQSYVDLLSR